MYTYPWTRNMASKFARSLTMDTSSCGPERLRADIMCCAQTLIICARLLSHDRRACVSGKRIVRVTKKVRVPDKNAHNNILHNNFGLIYFRR